MAQTTPECILRLPGHYRHYRAQDDAPTPPTPLLIVSYLVVVGALERLRQQGNDRRDITETRLAIRQPPPGEVAARVAPRSQQVSSEMARLSVLACLLVLCLFASTTRSQTTTPAPLTTTTTINSTSTTQEPEVTRPSHMGAISGNRQLEAAQVANNSKLKPVNFSLVDEVFESTLTDHEVVQRWRKMDAQLQDGVKSILKMIFPQIVALSQDAKVSGDCSGGILKWILSLRNLRSWAIKMLDATGKPTAGIFEGSLTMFGNYRQCLNVRAPDEDEIEITDQFEEYFRGQFCVLHLKPWMPNKKPFYHLNSTIESLQRKNYKYYEKTLYDELADIAIAFNFIDIRMDLCVPSTCSMTDIQRVAELLSGKMEMRAKVMRCDVQPRDSASLLNQIDRPTTFWLMVLACLLLISFVPSILILLIDLVSMCRSAKQSTGASSFIVKSLRSLTVQDAIADRFRCAPITQRANTDDHHNDPSKEEIELIERPLPLYGLRSLFVIWFIVVQMTVELNYQYLRDSLVLRNLILNYWPFQIIVNSSLLFESLIIITAFTFGYRGLGSTLKDLFKSIVDKYLRLIVPIITLVALTVATPVLFIESPLWRNFVESQSAVCKSTGHFNLFFLQNFISYDKICLPHTWIFCVELQLCLLAIPLCLLLGRNHNSCEDHLIISQSDENKKGATRNHLISSFTRLLNSNVGLLCILITATGCLINAFTVYYNQLPPSWFYTFPDLAQKNFYFSVHLTKTWAHLSSFMIGFLAGHLCSSSVRLDNLLINRDSRRPSPKPSPSSTSTCQSRPPSLHSHGSTSTIMALELSSQKTDDGLSDNHSTSAQDIPVEHRLASIAVTTIALASMSLIVFSTYRWSTSERPTELVAAMYDAFSRLIWSLALIALMIQLSTPKPKASRFHSLAALLSHPSMVIIGRLSFLAYLLSPYVNTFVSAVEEQSLFPSLFMIFHVIVGNIVIIYVLALVFSLVVEQPTRQFIKYLLRRPCPNFGGQIDNYAPKI